MLTAYIRSLLWNQSALDDVFQETAIVAWRKFDDFDRSRPFGAWVRGIAQRIVLDHHKRGRNKAAATDPVVLAELDRRFEHAESGAAGDLRDRVRRCTEALPAPMREVVDLTYARGMLLAAIARSLNMTEEAVKKRVQRARQLIAECLRGAGVIP